MALQYYVIYLFICILTHSIPTRRTRRDEWQLCDFLSPFVAYGTRICVSAKKRALFFQSSFYSTLGCPLCPPLTTHNLPFSRDGVHVPPTFVSSASTTSLTPQFPFHPPPVHLQLHLILLLHLCLSFPPPPCIVCELRSGANNSIPDREIVYSFNVRQLRPPLVYTLLSSVPHTYLPTYLPSCSPCE